MAALGIPGFMLDLGWGESSLQLLLSLLSMVLQFWLTASLVNELGLGSGSPRRFGSFIALVILTGLGVGLGFLFLVIPGIILAVRWSVSVPAVVADGNGYAEAIAYSWEATRPHFWPIFGTLVVVYLPGTVAAGVGLYLQLESIPAMGAALSELAINGSMVVGWFAVVAIFAALRPDNRLSEVFA